MTDVNRLRRALVRKLSESGSLRTDAVRDAFMHVPREVFVPEAAAEHGLAAVYDNRVFVTKTDSRGQPISSSSQPGIMAPMLDNLELAPGLRVLEIGAGTGYNAALMKHIVGARGRVTTLDIDADTARRARGALREADARVAVHHADGMRGWPPGAPYDRIIATASTDRIPRAWFAQIAPGGLVELPLRATTDSFGPQIVVTLRKASGRLDSVAAVPGGFMTIRAGDGSDALDFGYLGLGVRAHGKLTSVQFAGRAIERLSESARRRLIATIAGKPRRRVVFRGDGLRAAGLVLFAALAARPGTRVDSAGWASAILDRSGAGAATLSMRGDMLRSDAAVSVAAWGAKHAERELLALVDAWRACGRPRFQDVVVTVSYDGRSRRAWRRSARGDSTIFFDWSRPRRRA